MNPGESENNLAGPFARAFERARPRRARRIALVALLVLALAVLAASLITIPYYAETPGTGLAISQLIVVPKAQAHRHKGGVYLTDVDLQQLRAIEYPFFYFQKNATIVPASELTAPGVSNAQYDEEGVIDMTTARQAATVVAFRTLGYKVSAAQSGVAVYATEPGAPGSNLLVGDVITSLNGMTTLSIAVLSRAIDRYLPGTTVHLGVHLLGSKKRSRVSARLGELEKGASGAVSCKSVRTVVKKKTACLAVAPDQLYRTLGLPFPVELRSNGIIGPSAGLSFTLGLLDELDQKSLTGGRKIAATGTMSVNGSVGEVGGVAQKTVAVKAAGATVFLVPKGANYKTAKANAGSKLKVYAVSNIAQAVAVLEKLGGRLVR